MDGLLSAPSCADTALSLCALHRLSVWVVGQVREPKEQVERMNVPEEHLLGHAFHTYELVSPDGMVSFKFEHNVCGRSIYAQVRPCL